MAEFDDLDYDDHDFLEIGLAYESQAKAVKTGTIGADVKTIFLQNQSAAFEAEF